MKCELCGKRINEYGKYSAVIAGKEHYLCVWCYRKTQRNNEILKGCNDDTTIQTNKLRKQFP